MSFAQEKSGITPEDLRKLSGLGREVHIHRLFCIQLPVRITPNGAFDTILT